MTSLKLDTKTLWQAVLAEMEVNFSGLNYDMYISKTKAENLTDDSVDVICPSIYVQKKMELLFKPFLQESVNKIGKGKYELNFRVGSTLEKNKEQPKFEEPLFKNISPKENPSQKKAKETGLNLDYTFENFIMGGTNRLAYAIATAIADNPGKMHNPFFLYSGVGQGKTHLIHAIGNDIIKKHPNLSVVYCTGEGFMNELIETLQKGRSKKQYLTNTFRKKYRTADVLIIDDIQFIAGKIQTQEEFFHTFNELYMAQKQIVLASDRPPEEFKNFEERLTSRFRSGILADIQKPDFELRAAILRAKRDKEGDEFDNEVIDFIAENVDTNVRELVGSYQQVLTFMKAGEHPLSIELAEKALGGLIKNKRNKPVNINTIVKSVCNYYSVRIPDVKGKRRTKDLVIPRQISMYLIYELTNTPFASIGELLGGRDHTTVMHGVKKVETAIKEDLKTKQDVMNIKQFIYSI